MTPDELRETLGMRYCLAWTPEDFDPDAPGGWACTLQPGHDGEHEAWQVQTGELFAVWP